jgi:hypothetical protein
MHFIDRTLAGDNISSLIGVQWEFKNIQKLGGYDMLVMKEAI